MPFIAVIICGVLFRLDGVSKGDGFLPFWPFNNLKSGGINYARYAIPFVVFGVTHNPLHIASYAIAASIPYGEKHWWMRYSLVSWMLIGVIWGYASLSWGVALWLGIVVVAAKIFDLDQAYFEVMLGCGSTVFVLFN